MKCPRGVFLGPAAKAVTLLLAALAFSSIALAQIQRPGPPMSSGAPSSSMNPVSTSTIEVYLRTQDGQPLPEDAVPTFRLNSLRFGTPIVSFPSRTGDSWTFANLPTNNEYQIQVIANGYLPAQETVEVPDEGAGSITSVIMFLRPVDQELVFRRPTGQFVLAPRPEKEIQHALEDLQHGRILSARKHTKKAMNMAPGNPYVQYVMGITYLVSDEFAEAKSYLETSVSIDPRQAPSLSALGSVRYHLGDYHGAVAVLSKAVQLDPKSWKSEWLLAASDLREKNYADARDHAKRAIQLGKLAARPVQLLLGSALAGLGEREAAATEFETYAKEFPSSPETPKARQWAEMLRQPPIPPALEPKQQRVPKAMISSALPLTEATAASAVFPPQPPPEVPPSPNWAPPDVDAAHPFTVPTATCPLEQVLARAGKHAEEFVNTLQKFSANEDFQSVELKKGINLKRPSEYRFEYLVFVDRPSLMFFDVEEVRERNSERVPLPGRIIDEGAPALALAFHPIIQKDLGWKCEGLGTWDNQAAWVIHFEQEPKAPDVLHWFHGQSGDYPVPLKGRAWVSERSYQVLHLDTDLVGPVEAIDLKRYHASVDYRPVQFRQHKVRLWLPQTVDTFIQFQGHFYHFYHQYSDFKLFWVGASQKISAPKQAQKAEEQNRR